jgi:hypothetical protein
MSEVSIQTLSPQRVVSTVRKKDSVLVRPLWSMAARSWFSVAVIPTHKGRER